ncbi:MAG: copA [Planctomycetaceae bacterium]|nr:copA [Planctomycetaceae bacterium]
MSQPSPLQIDLKSRTVVLRTAALAQDSSWNEGRELIGRLLSAPCVESVAIDRTRGTATMHLAPATDNKLAASGNGSVELRTIAVSLRQSAAPQHLVGDAYAACKQVEIQKSESGITAGIIVHAIPGRVRLRHPLLRKNPDLAIKVDAAFGAVAGVTYVSASSATGSVLVLFPPGTHTPEKLLARLEQIINGKDDFDALLAGPPASYWVAAGTCLSLAVATEFFVPGLSTATAIALVGFNLPTLGRGLVELTTLKWGVPALYTVIMGTTLASGAYLAAAIMQASVTSWHCWSSYRLRQVVRELTLDQDLPERFQNGTSTGDADSRQESRLVPGMIVTVPVGVALPFDGIVVDGKGEFDEHRVRGVTDIAHRSSGDQVFAGSVMVGGQMRVEVVAVDGDTRLAKIRRTVRSVIGKTAGRGGPTTRGKALASRFVPYTFVTGTAAFMVGGLPTLAAVLRPDFATGPSLTERFGTLSGVSHLLHEGWLVNSPDALHELGKLKTIVIAHRDHESAEFQELRVIRTPLTVASRTVEVHEIAGSEDDCLEYIDELTAIGTRIAVVACHHILSQFMEDEVIRISFTPESGVSAQHADLIALHSQPQRLESLLRVLHETSAPGRNAWAVVLACNTLAISGAFLVGLTSLHVVVLTNIGALAAGAMYGRHMRHSSRLLASRRVRKVHVDHDILMPAPEEEADLEPVVAPMALTVATVATVATVEPLVVPTQPIAAIQVVETEVVEVEQLKPALRRVAARRDARLKQAATKSTVPPGANANEQTTP